MHVLRRFQFAEIPFDLALRVPGPAGDRPEVVAPDAPGTNITHDPHGQEDVTRHGGEQLKIRIVRK
jgi:hypothetical protein